MRKVVCPALLAAMALASCQQKQGSPQSAGNDAPPKAATAANGEVAAAKTPSPTLIAHQPTLEKILGNSGISLQWISWEPRDRGELQARWRGKTLYLQGEQKAPTGSASLILDGRVVTVTDNSFTFNGTLRIIDTPDLGRQCKKEGKSTFAITQNRKYFRLREFEWCDRLTDYVDIYF